MRKFFKVVNGVDSSGIELYIDGPIDSEMWWGDEATPQALRDELKKINSNRITVVINSGGGDVWAGLAMYNALRELDAEITVRVDGLAASIASVIAMAGDKIIMSPGSMMMIHKASAWAGGDAEELKKVIEMLETVEESIVPIYADRTGLDREKIQEMMDAETWMSSEEAVKLGFADEIGKKKEAVETEQSFSGILALSMSATKAAIEKHSAKAELTAEPEEENDSPNPNATDEVANDADDDEVEEETETDDSEEVQGGEPSGDLVETPDVENKSTNKENDMSKETDIAGDQIIPKNQATPTTTPQVSVKDYLQTKESMEAFAQILESNPGSGPEDTEAPSRVRAAWKQHLEVKLGVTNPEIFLPTPLIQEIEDAFKAGGEIWQRVSKTGLDAFNAAWDANTDPDAETGRAAGYNREDEEEKREQVLTFANRILRPQMVYKYITLNQEDVKEQRSTGALVRFVLSELPRRIIREVERAIVLGDGRAPSSDYKIQEGNPRGFYPILADAEANNVFAALYVRTDAEDNYASVVRASDLLEAEGSPVLITKKGFVTDMKLSTNANGGYIFPLGADFAGILGVDAIIEPDWFNDTSSPDVDAILVILPNYRVVGDQSVEAFTNFLLKTNKQEYLQEIWAGGGLTFRKTAVAISAPASS